MGVKEIDLVIINSETGKNFKALLSVLKNFKVKKIILKNFNDMKGETESIITENKITVEKINDIDGISGFGNLKFYFLKNDSCRAVKIVYGNKSFLFPGKAEEDEESELVKGYNDLLKSDVLKVARYGSDKSSSLEFLMKVKPEISIISTAGTKDRDLPSQNVLMRLKMLNSTIYRTDEEGAVILSTDGFRLKRE
jgi:competence protein ComEC